MSEHQSSNSGSHGRDVAGRRGFEVGVELRDQVLLSPQVERSGQEEIGTAATGMPTNTERSAPSSASATGPV